MDGETFDRITRALVAGTSRRGVLRRLAGGGLGGALAWAGLGRARAQDEDECPAKVGICHQSREGKFRYIRVCADAAPAHVKHGDLVACPNLQVIEPETCACICPVEDIGCPEGEVLDVDECVCVSTCPPSSGCTRGIDCSGGAVFQRCGQRTGLFCACVESLEGCFTCGQAFCGGACQTTEECVERLGPGAICQAAGTGCCGQQCIAACAPDSATTARIRSEGANVPGRGDRRRRRRRVP